MVPRNETYPTQSEGIGSKLARLMLLVVLPVSSATYEPMASVCAASSWPAMSSSATGGLALAAPAAVDMRSHLGVVRTEAEIAQRILSTLRTLVTDGSEGYLTELASILDGKVSVDRLPSIAYSMAQARLRLEASAANFQQWIQIRSAIDPNPEASWPVPERFVVWTDTPVLPDRDAIDDVESELALDQAVLEFFNGHADTSTGQA